MLVHIPHFFGHVVRPYCEICKFCNYPDAAAYSESSVALSCILIFLVNSDLCLETVYVPYVS